MSTTSADPLLDFTGAIFRPDDIIELRLIRPRDGKPDILQKWCKARDTAQYREWLADRSDDGFNVYVGANPRNAPGATGDDNITLARCVFADFDHCTVDEALVKITAAELPAPTIGNGSGHGYHPYWRLAEAITDLAAWTEIQKNLIALLGSDKSIHNPERIMRVPGFTNWKEPVAECSIVECDPSRVYEWADLLPLIPQRKSESANGKGQHRAEAIGEAINDGQRNNTIASLTGTMQRRGFTVDAIMAAALAENAAKCKPPLPDDEVGAIVKSISRYEPAAEHHRQFEMTETGMAERVVAHRGEYFYCVPKFGKFVVWDGRRFCIDDHRGIDRIIKAEIRAAKIEAARMPDKTGDALYKFAHSCESNAKINAIRERIKAEVGVCVQPEELDADSMLLNVRNGTIDLRTGKLLEHDRRHKITKLANVDYDPAASCPTFDLFLERILPVEAVRQFVQRAIGYSATGNASERALFMPFGNGQNGKSTFLGAVGEILGDYATSIRPESLMVKRDAGIGNDLAALRGARFVPAVETEEGRRLAESLVKAMTGNDLLSVRFLYGEYFSFRPTFKLWIGTNHKPVVRGTDQAIWDRIKLIPFTVRIPNEERDLKLADKLRAEYPGILAWIVRGCLEWQANELNAPDEVCKATKDYRDEMDVIGDFISDCCICGDKLVAGATPLFESYKTWCILHNEEAMTQRRFGSQLADRGFASERSSISGKMEWRGIGLKASG